MMPMKFDVVGSDDLSFPVAIEGSLTIKELCDKVQANHNHVLTSIGQGTRSDFLLALRYKENHALVPNEVVSQVLSDGDRLIAIWASTIVRVAPGRHKAALIKLSQHVVYANGSFFCTLGIVDSLAINSVQPGQVADSKISAPKKSRVNEASKPSAAASSGPAPASAAAGQLSSSGRLPAQPAESKSASEASSSSSSSVSSESSAPRRSPVLPAQLVTHTVHITSSNSESSSSSSSVSSSASSTSVSSASSTSSSSAGVASKAAVASATPKRATPGAQPAPPAKAPAPPRAATNPAETARKSAPAKAANAAAPVKSAAAMPSPAAPTEKAILAQISNGVAIPSSAPKKRGARGGKNSASNKAKTAASS